MFVLILKMDISKLKRRNEFLWEIEKQGEMLVPGWIFADLELIKEMDEKVYEQLSNVACLPGIQKASIAMPDAHWGYGFCLHPDSEVLMDEGFTIKIKDLENVQSRVLVFKGKKRKKLCSASIKKFFKVKPYNRILKIKTDLGNEIIASEDHPFYTQHGMLKAGKLKKGDLIATYLFRGVCCSKPSNRVIVNEKLVLEKLESLGIDRKSFRARLIITKLKQRELLPLGYNHPKISILIKLVGFLFGDGSMNFIGKRRDGILSFSGKKEDLEIIREDIKKLGYTPSPLHRNGKEFVVNASSLLVLMYCLGVPLGNKSKQRMRVPAWLYKAEPWQKRLFISALFGCELRKPYPRKDKKANFSAPVLTVGKEKKLERNAYEYLNDIKNLLNEFGIKVLYIKKHREHKAKDGTVSVHIDLVISPSTENLIRLYEKVSYLYNSERKWLADIALAYLRFKHEILEEKEKVIPVVEELLRKGESYRSIAKALATANPISERFLMDMCWKISKGKKDISPLVPKTFPTFEDFVRERTKGLGKSGLVWAKIKEIKEVDYDEEFVYDLTVDDEDHNFIANGFVVSNCIGGVAAFDPEENGVISVGGVGFDINCGIATLKTNLTLDEVKPKIKELVDELFARVPAGLGRRGEIRLSREEQFEVMKEGAKWVVEKGYGYEEDLDYIEENGRVDGAVPENVSETALKRERGQVGTLGSGNHYLEVQYVDEIYDEKTAKAFGFERNQILVTLHCGSRALGHQIGTDYLKILAAASRKYGIKIRERELVCAPINSPEGQRYFGAVNCAVNYAFANRQVIAHLSREAFKKVFPDAELKMFYNIGHNTVKVEWHDVDGNKKRLYVHRKGSTRSFGPGREELPKAYREIGQPVLIGGTMGTCSYVLVGTKEGEKISFGSVCHGAGRTMSRHQAKRTWRGTELVKLLWEKYGIYVRAHSMPGLAEEAPGAYKDVTKVVDVIHNSGLAKKVIKVKPLGVVKG
ncbi:RNA-splicing ligase RtcB [Candidatus Woesearchaeota archaeon]|nr:MAG: RNA-splicing ligase RtcB [Candidatus Woesearchaeota archaeon]